MSGKNKKTNRKKLTAEGKQEDRLFLLRCIELYRSMPVLWKIKSEEYMDRDKKAQALEQLLELYQQRYPKATADDVKRKFNSLRTNFRKDLKKLNDAKKSGAGRDDLYVPTCWYFDDMYFIVDQETPSESINTMEDKDSESDEETEISRYMEEPIIEQSQCSESQPIQKKSTAKEELPTQRKKKKIEDPADELLRLAVDRLQKSLVNNGNLNIAASWAKDISTMEQTQQVLAKKFINDIIFEGQMNTLHRNSIVINQPPVSTPI